MNDVCHCSVLADDDDEAAPCEHSLMEESLGLSFKRVPPVQFTPLANWTTFIEREIAPLFGVPVYLILPFLHLESLEGLLCCQTRPSMSSYILVGQNVVLLRIAMVKETA